MNSLTSQLDTVLALLDKAIPVNGWRYVESRKEVVEQSATMHQSNDPPIMARFEVWHRWRAELGYSAKEGEQPPEQVVISAEDAKTIANFLREHGPAIRAAVGGEAVAWQYRMRVTFEGGWTDWSDWNYCSKPHFDWINHRPRPGESEYETRSLYASPTATVDVGALKGLMRDLMQRAKATRTYDTAEARTEARTLEGVVDKLDALIGKEA